MFSTKKPLKIPLSRKKRQYLLFTRCLLVSQRQIYLGRGNKEKAYFISSAKPAPLVTNQGTRSLGGGPPRSNFWFDFWFRAFDTQSVLVGMTVTPPYKHHQGQRWKLKKIHHADSMKVEENPSPAWRYQHQQSSRRRREEGLWWADSMVRIDFRR